MPETKKRGEVSRDKVRRPPARAVDIAHEQTPQNWRSRFAALAKLCSNAVGSPVTFLVAFAIVLLWGATGPMFGFSDTWQLIINTGTTIITFLMVFLIQNTQNRDAKAIHFKLDELIHAVHGAHEELIDVEDLTDEELEKLAEHYHQVREERASKRASAEAQPVKPANGNKKSKPSA
jgi:low affinity Fe/Cu permease